MKGIILAGGTGSRLLPLTAITNKHLLPVYNKPMILYPLETLKRSGIEEIMVITGKVHAGHFMNFLGSGKKYGVRLSYALQDEAAGIADALSLAEDFADGGKIAVILGDNIFEDDFLNEFQLFEKERGTKLFFKESSIEELRRMGVPVFQGERIVSIEEKPENPKSPYVVTGLYLYDADVFDKIKADKPSARGEMEITSINNMYVRENKALYTFVKGKWLDAGTHEALLRAHNLVARNFNDD